MESPKSEQQTGNNLQVKTAASSGQLSSLPGTPTKSSSSSSSSSVPTPTTSSATSTLGRSSNSGGAGFQFEVQGLNTYEESELPQYMYFKKFDISKVIHSLDYYYYYY